MASHLRITIDRKRPLFEQPELGHNRWHPDIAPIGRVGDGAIVELQARDSQDGQITTSSRGEDLLGLRPNVGHPLTGPVYVEGAEPGDLLAIDILDVKTENFGFTAFGHRYYALLRDEITKPFVVRWKLEGGYATSEDLPRVRIPGAPFMGVMGVAPSHELMATATAREAELLERGGLVMPPNPVGAVPASEPVASTGLRTIPPRENGGNSDIKQLVAGTTLFLPVFVPGALFSTGDGHFAQGDGESCGTAIETGTTLTARLRVLKGEARRRNQRDASFECTHANPRTVRAAPYYATTGTCVTRAGRNENEDVFLACKNAIHNMVDHLGDKYGYSEQQAYALCSVAVDLHVSQIVNAPNVTVSAFLPVDIFER